MLNVEMGNEIRWAHIWGVTQVARSGHLHYNEPKTCVPMFKYVYLYTKNGVMNILCNKKKFLKCDCKNILYFLRFDRDFFIVTLDDLLKKYYCKIFCKNNICKSYLPVYCYIYAMANIIKLINLFGELESHIALLIDVKYLYCYSVL